jgi:hypothetical protein
MFLLLSCKQVRKKIIKKEKGIKKEKNWGILPTTPPPPTIL